MQRPFTRHLVFTNSYYNKLYLNDLRHLLKDSHFQLLSITITDTQLVTLHSVETGGKPWMYVLHFQNSPKLTWTREVPLHIDSKY